MVVRTEGGLGLKFKVLWVAILCLFALYDGSVKFMNFIDLIDKRI